MGEETRSGFGRSDKWIEAAFFPHSLSLVLISFLALTIYNKYISAVFFYFIPIISMSIIASKIIEVCIFKFERDQPRYLLLHRSKEERIYPDIWQFVSGSIEENESAVDAALRELSEETGLKPKAFWVVPHISMFYDPGYDTVNLCPLFAVQSEAGSNPRLSAEHYEFGWFSFQESIKKLVWPSQRQGLQLVNDYIVRGEQVVQLTKLQ